MVKKLKKVTKTVVKKVAKKGAAARSDICPKSGAFTAFKKLEDGYIAVLHIPADAKRLCGEDQCSHGSFPRYPKCRASKALVVAIFDKYAKSVKTGDTSIHGPETTYTVGKVVKPDKFDNNKKDTCSNGIHFYMTLDGALAH